jgi:hypothetical protein
VLGLDQIFEPPFAEIAEHRPSREGCSHRLHRCPREEYLPTMSGAT